MSSGTNTERITQNNTKISTNNTAIDNFKTAIQNLPSKDNNTQINNPLTSNYLIRNIKEIPELDLINLTTMDSICSNCEALTHIELKNTSSVTSMQGAFSSCRNLESITQFDTSNVTTTQNAFMWCSSLVSVPVFNLANVVTISSMFSYCNSLSNESLNNIMKSCISATKVSTKTLRTLGITQAQATTCQGLSNYNDFINAGWTTGY